MPDTPRLTADIVDEIRRRHTSGESTASLANALGIDARHVHRIAAGESSRPMDFMRRRPGTTRLTPDDVREIRALAADGQPTAEIAGRFGIHERTVRRIVSRERWGHVR